MTQPDARQSIVAEVERLAKKFAMEPDLAFNVWVGKYVLGLDESTAFESAAIDGGNDKGIDVFHVDPDREVVFICQNKFSSEFKQKGKEPHVNALLGALTWLDDPESLANEGRAELANAAQEYSDALKKGYAIEIAYIHAGERNPNVAKQIRVLNENKSHIEANRHFRYLSEDEIYSVDEEANNLALRITKETLAISQGALISQEQAHYAARVGVIPASELKRLYEKYGDRLFDRNVRLYLGARKGSVNSGMHATLHDADEHSNFWAYNNGITIICSDFEHEGNELQIRNFSIINGCQTTVTISRSAADLEEVFVLAKIIRIRPENVDDVIRFNNSQNPMKSWDIASQHPVHRRLKSELDELAKPYLYKTRRGDKPKGSLSRYKSGSVTRQIESDRLAQYRAAFLGRPALAWKNKSEIFDPTTHDQIYPKDLTVEEALFAWIAGEACSEINTQSLAKAEAGGSEHVILRNGGAYFTVAALARVFNKRNGSTALAGAKADRITSSAFKEKITRYARYAQLNYIDAVTELSSNREIDLVPLLKSADFTKQVLEKIERQVQKDQLAQNYIDEALPLFQLSK